ncbi:MAG: putative Serine/threonine-protein phosphatase 5 [Streblomastix strix]|uniref:Serine/threonine-protein phosphatase n=2 Tax=Streblomastix strix TaxID=222440 RepID=A0A5J4VL33_9EUKA|nr:MAG: putative Serine/threonine-protein phosphatase 5 [Streblomastix strix]
MAPPKKKKTETSSDILDVPDRIGPDYIAKLIDAFRAQKRLKNNLPSVDNPYLFNGDWVDRGPLGCEITLLLFAIKLSVPRAIHLIRGNHESFNCTKDYGFKAEVIDKYDLSVYQNFLHCFNALPICAVINRKAFVVHGGLFGRMNVTLEEIKSINRFNEPGEEGGEQLMAQMLWSDASETNGLRPANRPFGVLFGSDVTQSFLDTNSLSIVIRSHEQRQQGYSIEHDGNLITVFSAPGYCGCDNKGAYLILSGRTCQQQFRIMNPVPHPVSKQYFNEALLFGK